MSISVKKNVQLSTCTIYRIGGPARFFVDAKNSEELKEALGFAAKNNLKFLILGAGSNVLISDKGFDGLVIKMNLRGIHSAGSGRLTVESGVSMAQAVLAAAKAGLTGFEWAIGVPGTIGGSIRGNAGCFGGEMKDVVGSVTILKAENLRRSDLQILNNSECKFSYRDSIFKKHPEWVIISVTLKLQKGDSKKIQDKIKKVSTERSQKQDIGTKSCGCIFKNVSWSKSDINKEGLLQRSPELEQFKDKQNIPASFLIDSAGLKGKCIGKICISSKHANFFVNEGGATAKEVAATIKLAKDAVKNKYGILLEEEIQYVGF